MARLQAIVMKTKDNVCTVVEAIAPGMDAGMEIGGETKIIRANEPIPVGHKLAIRDINKGDIIMKYGEVIGRATQGHPYRAACPRTQSGELPWPGRPLRMRDWRNEPWRKNGTCM